MKRTSIALALVVAVLACGATLPVHAESQGVVAVVNDQPVTERDISARIAILKILGSSGLTRKKALQELVDEQVKLSEAKKYNMTPSESDVTGHIERMAKGLKSTPDGLLSRLKKQGISEAVFRRYITAQIGFNRIIQSKYRTDINVSAADVDRKYNEIKSTANSKIAEIMKDPRLKPVTVYTVMEISLPVEGDDSMLLQARAVEASQVLKRLKGCGNARAAAEGIFNVKIGKKVEADASKIPKQMKTALDKAGVGRAIGPMRGKGGIQLLAFCGSRKITPPKPKFDMPTRDQVENALLNEKYDQLEENYLKTVRDTVYVEYRDNTYSQ